MNKVTAMLPMKMIERNCIQFPKTSRLSFLARSLAVEGFFTS